jgi:hypothetical protein
MSDGLRSLAALAALPAIAFLVVVHRTVFSGLFAARLVSRKRCRTNHCRQSRKQDFGVSFHKPILVLAVARTSRKRVGHCSSVMKIDLIFANQLTVDIETPEVRYTVTPHAGVPHFGQGR